MSARPVGCRRLLGSGFFVAVGFLSNHAFAQSCSTSAVTIQNAADATAIAPCPTFTGNIQIASGATGNISLDGVETLNGYLIASGVNELVSLSADSLERIEDYMYLQNLPQLSNLSFPRLKYVGDRLRLEQLPVLSQLGFDAVLTYCPFFSVSGTALESVAGIDPTGPTFGFTITNNTSLRNITMNVNSTRLTYSPYDAIKVTENSPELNLSFPKLVSSQNMEISNLSSVTMPSITDSNEIALRSNSFKSFGVPKLVHGGNSTWGMWFENNTNLVDIEMPLLASTGGYTVFGSPQFHNLTLPKLKNNTLGFRLEGSLTMLSIPAINNVSGDFALTTSSQDFDCSPFQTLKDQNIIHGAFKCITGSSTPSAQPTSSPSAGLSTGAKAGVGIGVGGGVSLLALLVFVLHRRQRQKQRTQNRRKQPVQADISKRPAEMSDATEKKELPGFTSLGEMPTSPTGAVNELEPLPKMHELQANREFAELEAKSEPAELPGDQPKR